VKDVRLFFLGKNCKNNNIKNIILKKEIVLKAFTSKKMFDFLCLKNCLSKVMGGNLARSYSIFDLPILRPWTDFAQMALR
jgi:hypothetical protein